jgi:hypothetical protein
MEKIIENGVVYAIENIGKATIKRFYSNKNKIVIDYDKNDKMLNISILDYMNNLEFINDVGYLIINNDESIEIEFENGTTIISLYTSIVGIYEIEIKYNNITSGVFEIEIN